MNLHRLPLIAATFAFLFALVNPAFVAQLNLTADEPAEAAPAQAAPVLRAQAKGAAAERS